jgi:hypothetical protein
LNGMHHTTHMASGVLQQAMLSSLTTSSTAEATNGWLLPRLTDPKNGVTAGRWMSPTT